MRMPTTREWALLAVALPVLLLAAAAEQEGPGDEVAAARVGQRDRASTEARRSADADELNLALLRREAKPAEPANAFEIKSWYVPPPAPPPAPPPKALPPPAPKAPPLPFIYLGRYQDAAAPVIFLVRGDRVLAVHAGDVIEGTYRVDEIAGATLRLTYLPLKIMQTLDIENAG